jgi:hypothetical protein|uniref:Uncharacterized protein n=1 Tax=Zea mays TaxID=4577 RepID=B4FFK2_MAIZE|nr:unknown [Zea mays]
MVAVLRQKWISCGIYLALRALDEAPMPFFFEGAHLISCYFFSATSIHAAGIQSPICTSFNSGCDHLRNESKPPLWSLP